MDRHVGARLRAERLKNSLTIGTVAQALNVTERRVALWEDGTYRISAYHLLAVSQLLSCPLAAFFDGFPVEGPLADDIEPTENQVNWLFHRFSGAKH